VSEVYSGRVHFFYWKIGIIIILDNLTIVEFIYLKKPARSAGPVLPPRIERRGTIRHGCMHGCMRRIRRRMKHAAPPRHREARRHDREAPGSTGKHREDRY
jgi:hypothetical protein